MMRFRSSSGNRRKRRMRQRALRRAPVGHVGPRPRVDHLELALGRLEISSPRDPGRDRDQKSSPVPFRYVPARAASALPRSPEVLDIARSARGPSRRNRVYRGSARRGPAGSGDGRAGGDLILDLLDGGEHAARGAAGEDGLAAHQPPAADDAVEVGDVHDSSMSADRRAAGAGRRPCPGTIRFAFTSLKIRLPRASTAITRVASPCSRTYSPQPRTVPQVLVAQKR